MTADPLPMPAAFRERRPSHARRRERSLRAMLPRLADWLLEGSVAFRRLDAFRVELGLEVAAMARLLGIAETTYARWRRLREVPLSGRERMHESVLAVLDAESPPGAVVSAGPLSSYPLVTVDAQNPRKEPVLVGLAMTLHGVRARLAFRTGTPSRTTALLGDWRHAPHLWLALEGAAQRTAEHQARGELVRMVREAHGDGCECRVCASGPCASERGPA